MIVAVRSAFMPYITGIKIRFSKLLTRQYMLQENMEYKRVPFLLGVI